MVDLCVMYVVNNLVPMYCSTIFSVLLIYYLVLDRLRYA